MISPILSVLVSLFLFTTLCNALCKVSHEDGLSVDCTYSDLTDVPTSLTPRDVKSLDLSCNWLTKLNRSDWKDYDHLENLFFTENWISIIDPDVFLDLKNLRNLDLSYNRLRYISPDMISGNTLLEIVSFRGNSELYLPPNSHFLASKSLISLDISYCSLTSLNPKTFSKMQHLVYIDVRSNSLATVSLETFEYLKHLNSLNLMNNKWNCDCGVVEVLNWVSVRRRTAGLHIEHSPLKCVDKEIYRTLWTANSLNESCHMGSVETDSIEKQNTKTPASIQQETRNDEPGQSAEDDPQVGTKFGKADLVDADDASNYRKMKTSRRFQELWNTDLILVFCVLPITLGIAVFIALLAVYRCTNWLDSKSRTFTKLKNSTCRGSQVPLVPSSSDNDLKNVSNSKINADIW